MDHPTVSEKEELDKRVTLLPAGNAVGGLRAVLNGTCEAIGIIPPSGEDEKDKGLLPLLLEMEKRGGVGGKGREAKAILDTQMEKLKRVCMDEPPNRSLCLIVFVLSWCSESAYLRNGCTRAIAIIQKKEGGLETLNSTRTELLYSFRNILPGGRYERKSECDGTQWTMVDKLLSALNQVEAKRTTELDPVEDRWAVECELGLVHMAEKAAKMANEGEGEAAVVRLWTFRAATALSCLQALLLSFSRNRSQEDIDITSWTEYRFYLARAVHACCSIIPLCSAPKDAVTQLAVAALQISREHWKREGQWDGGQGSASLIASALDCNYHPQTLSEDCGNLMAPPEVQLSLISAWLQKNGPPLALVALARGVMSCCTSEESSVLITSLGHHGHQSSESTRNAIPPTEDGLASCLLYGVLPSVLLFRCSSPDPMLRHVSLQVSQMWIHRAYQYSVSHIEASKRLYEDLITEAENVIIWNIDNPTRKASRLIIDSFQHVIQWRLALDLPFTDITRKITKLRNDRKDKYVALSLLLDVAGPSRTLSMIPYVVRQLLIAIGNTANVGKAASSLLLRLLPHHEDWESDVVHILVGADDRLRQRLLDFFLPAVIKHHIRCAPRLCKLIIESSNQSSQQNLRLMLEVIALARQSGAFPGFEIGDGITNSGGVGIVTTARVIDNANAIVTAASSSLILGSNDIERAYFSRDPRLRIAALSLLTAGFKRGSIPPPHEIHHLFQGLELCLKTAVSKECSEIVRLVRQLALGLGNAARQSCRNQQQNGKQQQYRLKDCEQYVKRLGIMVLDSIYPGTPFEREILGVQLVLALLECLCSPFHQIVCDKQQHKQNFKLEITASPPPHELFPLHEATASILYTPHAVKLLMGLLMSTWERTRQLAAELLKNHIPAPLPGLECPSSVAHLMTWGIFASSSSRSRDFDAGSLLVSLLFSLYAMKHGWLFESHETDSTDVGGPPRGWRVTKPEGQEDIIIGQEVTEAAVAAPRYFIFQLLKVLRNRIKSMAAARMTVMEEELPPLKSQSKMISSDQRLPQAVGVLVALKKCMEQVFLVHMDVTEWRSTINEVYNDVSMAFDLALTVLAQNTVPESSDYFQNQESSYHRAQNYCSVGPVDSNHSIGSVNIMTRPKSVMIAQQRQQHPVELDCRGHLLVNGTTPEEGSGVGSLHQQVVVGSWLMAKEAAFVLSDLVTKAISCVAPNTHSATSSMLLLTEVQVERVGHSFWNALLSMRHMGAISTVRNAFQKVCEALLQKCTIATLAALPMRWLRRLLQRIREENDQFVLHRSSGFAMAFQAILRAEPRDGQPILLHEAMEELLKLASVSGKSQSANQGSNNGRTGIVPKEGWKARVHALNVLRMLIGDANMPSDMLKVMTRSITTALEGFEDEMWAVRNSCLMLFAAILRRITVYPNSSPSSSYRLAASPRSLNMRTLNKYFPGLHLYLIDAIRLGTSAPSTSITQISCHILFPILVFLAQFHTSGKAIEVTTGLEGTETDNNNGVIEAQTESQTEFIRLIQCTASSPEFAIRDMGAKVLTSLVKDSDSCQFLVSVLEVMIPAEPPEVLTNHNTIHGALLQVLSLLRKNNSTASSDPVVINALLQRSWLTDPELCKCPTVRLVMHRVLDYLSEDVIPFLGELRTHCWTCSIGFDLLQSLEENDNGNKTNFIVDETMLLPGQPELWFECAASWCFSSVSVLFHHVIGAPPDVPEPDPDLCVTSQYEKEMLSISSSLNVKSLATIHFGGDESPRCDYLCLFSSKVLEFRSGAASGALKAIRKFDSSSGNNISDEREVHIDCEGLHKLSDAALVAALCEDHPPTRITLTQVICRASAQLPQLSEMFMNSRLRVLQFAESSMVDTQSAPSDALELLGHCVRGMVRQQLEDCPKQFLVHWVDILMKASNPNIPATFRRSAAASLHAGYTSIVELHQSFSNGFIVARAHYIALILLNDDDVNIRSITADTVAGSNYPLVEERAVRSVAEALGGCNGPEGLVMLFHILREVSLGAADAVKRFACHHTDYDGSQSVVSSSCCCSSSSSDAVFEDEDVNSHGEDTILAREAARALITNFRNTSAACLIERCGGAVFNDAIAILDECKIALRCLIAAHMMKNDKAVKEDTKYCCLTNSTDEGTAADCGQMNYFTFFGCGYDCRVFPKLMSAFISAGVAVTLANSSILVGGSNELNGDAEMYGGVDDDYNAGVLVVLKKSALEVAEVGVTVMNLVAAGTLPPFQPSMEIALQYACNQCGYTTVEDIELLQLIGVHADDTVNNIQRNII